MMSSTFSSVASGRLVGSVETESKKVRTGLGKSLAIASLARANTLLYKVSKSKAC